MTAHRYGLAVVASAVLWIGCDNSSDTGDSAVPDQSDGRMTIVNDEAKLAQRLTLAAESVPIDTTIKKTSARVAFSLTLEAEIQPPTVNGTKLQATSVALDGNFAYVTYAVAGSAALGGVDIIQVKGGKNASIRSSVTFTDTDVNAVSYFNNAIYLAEATNNPSFDPLTAVAEMIPCSGNKLSLSGSLRRPVASFVATGALASNGTFYLTTGNTGFLYRLNASTLAVLDSAALSDARGVAVDASRIAVVQGTPGRLAVFDRTTGARSTTHTFEGASIAESKSTVRVLGGKAIIAAGDGGVKIMNLATGSVVGSLPQLNVPGLSAAVTVTNAVDASSEYLYISNGEGGVSVARASRNLSDDSGNAAITLTSLGRLQFGSLQSVNHVAFDGEILLIASGLGGVKVVKARY
jgi:outer membrane protein assembly factor BamB